MNGKALPKVKTKIPGPRSKALAKKLQRFECPNITSGDPIFWEKGCGSNIQDIDGNLYLDLTGGFGVAGAGHANPNIVRSLIRQATKLPHTLGDIHPSPSKVDLAQALVEICPKPLRKVFFATSGAEAVEIAIKTAKLATKKPGIIVFDGSYHGLTYGALSATSLMDFKDPFKDQINPHIYRVPYPVSSKGRKFDGLLLKTVETLISHEPIGAVLIEPVQGRGGIRIASSNFLKALRSLCTQKKVLLIADEIYSGMGRTGRWFAFEHSRIVPDLVTVGKSLSGGFPISACIGKDTIMQAWPRHHGEALHTSTFMGNPMGCAMAVASLQETKSKHFLERNRTLGDYLIGELCHRLKNHSEVGEIRGRGLMVGIEIIRDRKTMKADPEKAWQITNRCLKEGLILLCDGQEGNILTITPSFTITKNQIDFATDTIEKCLKTLKN